MTSGKRRSIRERRWTSFGEAASLLMDHPVKPLLDRARRMCEWRRHGSRRKTRGSSQTASPNKTLQPASCERRSLALALAQVVQALLAGVDASLPIGANAANVLGNDVAVAAWLNWKR